MGTGDCGDCDEETSDGGELETRFDEDAERGGAFVCSDGDPEG